jgi:hypothetical protein
VRSIIDCTYVSPDRVHQQPRPGTGITDDVLFPKRLPTEFQLAPSTMLTVELTIPTDTVA